MKDIDPFFIGFIFTVIFSVIFIGSLVYSDLKEKEIQANFIEKAIERGWTPEQIKNLVEAQNKRNR